MKNYTMLITGLLVAFNMASAQELKLPSVQPLAALVERDGKFYQPVTISLDYQGGPADASLQIGEGAAVQIKLTTGIQRVEGLVPAVEKESQVQVRLTTGEKELVSQPLIAVAASGGKVKSTPVLSVEPAGVIVTGFKPSDDGKAVIVRLFGASGKDCKVKLNWAEPSQGNVYLSNTSEKPLEQAGKYIKVPAWGIVTLRAERLAATTFALRALPATGFHVAITGNDANPGTQAAPLRTIQHAADLAQPGDTVTVHSGVYRERINPPRGGESDTRRIVYQAAAGEKVIITGSEEVKNWEKVRDGVWRATIPNSFFGSFNPFAELLSGDWFDDQGRNHHAGAVYLNGDWLSEAVSREEVMKPITETPLWFASVDTTSTVIWAQFKGVDPNTQQVEVNARQTVFYPDKPGRNFITVRGFTLRNAATPWAPPTVEQIGLIGVNWSKGWIIEDNDISYSRCAGISLGKYGDAKDINEGWAEGYVRTIERALQNGWNKETIGHHMVRNNHISNCGQAGIVGSLGAVFSTVTGNTIHDIHIRQLFSGAEMAGIKFHGAIDVTISRNHVYRNCRGIWLDWMTQGARISGNLCHENDINDLSVEANHGPFVVDNNIFLSPKAIEDDSQGVAFAHNLIAGGINLAPGFLDGRKTPFHKAHSTEIVALHDNPSGDNHFDNNLFMRSGSLAIYDEARLPMWMEGNVFFLGANSSKHESAPINRSASDPALTLVEKSDGFYLTMTLTAALGSERPSQPVTSARLGKASISGCAFENPDGSPITIGTDYFGRPRNATNPTPGPFETPGTGTITMKVWPLASTSGRAGAPNFWDDIPLSPSTKMPSVVLDDYWNSEYQRVNREVAAAQNTRLVFFGDSMTWCWSLGDLTGQAVWNENYSQYNPINMGNSGDITPVMLYRVNHGNLDFASGRQPKVAVLLCGINNFGVSQSAGGREQWHLGTNCPPADIANGRRAIAQVFRRRLPETRVIMMALLPVADEGKRAKSRQVNAINAALSRNDNEVVYVDLQDKFLLPDGSINRQLFTDGTHLTPEGYRVWAKGIEPLVLKFMEAPPLKPLKIMLIGDSSTEGPDSNGSYRRYLDGMLRRDGHLIDFVGSRKKHSDDKIEPDNYEYDVDHEGHWGKSSEWMAENMQSLLASNVPDVAVIQLGTEDIISSKVAAEPLADGIVKNIGRVVDTLRARNGNMNIVLSAIIPVAGKQDVVNLVNLKIARYVQCNATLLHPVVLADPYKGFDVSRDLAADGAHPNAAGAGKMASVFADVIQRLLRNAEHEDRKDRND